MHMFLPPSLSLSFAFPLHEWPQLLFIALPNVTRAFPTFLVVVVVVVIPAKL